jgi:hypothetical protein
VPGSGSGGRYHRALPEVHPAERQPEGLAAKAAGDSCCVNVNQCYLCTSVDGTELLARDRDRLAREPARQQADTAVGALVEVTDVHLNDLLRVLPVQPQSLASIVVDLYRRGAGKCLPALAPGPARRLRRRSPGTSCRVAVRST